MVVIPECSWKLGVRINIQPRKLRGTVEKLIQSLPFLISKNVEILLLVGHVANSSGLMRNPSKGVAIEVRSNLKSVDMRGNGVVAESDWHLCIGSGVNSEISWVKVSAALPVLRLHLLEALLGIVLSVVVWEGVHLVAIITLVV